MIRTNPNPRSLAILIVMATILVVPMGDWEDWHPGGCSVTSQVGAR